MNDTDNEKDDGIATTTNTVDLKCTKNFNINIENMGEQSIHIYILKILKIFIYVFCTWELGRINKSKDFQLSSSAQRLVWHVQVNWNFVYSWTHPYLNSSKLLMISGLG